MIPKTNKFGLRAALLLILVAAASLIHSQQAASITGTVKNAQGQPVGGANVTLIPASSNASAQRATTDADGKYALRNLSYGAYTLSVESAAGRATPKNVQLGSATLGVDVMLVDAAGATGLNAAAPGKTPPTFTASGVHGTIAPSGYSTGMRSEDAAQVQNRVSDLSADLMAAYVPSGSIAGCGRLADLKAAAEASPASFKANQELGLYYLGNNQVANSIEYLKRATAAKPDDVANELDLAFALVVNRSYPDALAILYRVTAGNNGGAAALRLMALTYGKIGDSQKAKSAYLRAAQLDASVDNQFNCGIGLVGVAASSDAEQLLLAAAKAHPDAARLWMGLGIAQELDDKKSDAVVSLLKAVDLDPGYQPAYSFLANLSGVSKQSDAEIRRRLAARVVSQSDSAAAHYDYALALWKDHAHGDTSVNVAEVESELRSAVRKAPEMKQAHFQLGVVYVDESDYAHGRAEFEETLRLDPENAQAHYRLAQVYKHEALNDQANAEMKQFLELKETAGDRSDDSGLDVEKMLLKPAAAKPGSASCPGTRN